MAQTWSQQFAQFLEKNGLSRLDAQIKLKVHTSVIHDWLHGATPRLEMRRKIERWSGGAVKSEIENGS